MNSIYTEQLILMPITFEITVSLLENKTDAITKLGLHTDGSWPTADTMDILPIIYNNLKGGVPSGFETWLIVKKDNNKIIGDIGFHGKPNERGEAEIGYGLVQAEQGKGFCYEAVKAIVDWVSVEDSVQSLKAVCLVDNIASAKILQRVGMREIKREEGYRYWMLTKE